MGTTGPVYGPQEQPIICEECADNGWPPKMFVCQAGIC